MKAKAEVMHSAFFLYLEVIPGKEKKGPFDTPVVYPSFTEGKAACHRFQLCFAIICG